MSDMTDVLAEAVFVADNHHQPKEDALLDWAALKAVQGDDTYAHHIARGLSAAGFGPVREAKAEAWDEGTTAGLGCNSDRGEEFGTPNPYHAATVRGGE